MQPELIFEAEQDAGFFDELCAAPGGGSLRSCLQCGTCSASCPAARVLVHTPRRLFAMARAGMKRQVLESNTAWVCASCYACTVRCPAGISITEIMYTLKRMALAQGITPAGSDAQRFATIFTDGVSARGRAAELEAMVRYMIFHHPGRLLGQAPVGLSMLARGRMPVLPHRIAGLASFTAMVRRARELEEEPS